MANCRYEIWACPKDHVHLTITSEGVEPVLIIFDNPDEAYHFAQAILRAYDEAEGIEPPQE